MQSKHETLGEIIKNARIKADITVEDLAAKVGVGERFIYRIENEGKKPSYDILYKLIRELSILPDQIFFPEKQIEDSEMESLVRMLYNCDERSMQIIKRFMFTLHLQFTSLSILQIYARFIMA